MPSQVGGGDSGYGGNQTAAKPRGQQTQTLRAVTVKQLVQNISATDDDSFTVDGIELSNVTVVGKITKVQNTATHMSLNVHDGTGEVEIMQWNSSDDVDYSAGNRGELQRNVYVRVYGHVRSFEKKKNIHAYKIRVIQDFNEVTYHFLQVIFQHLHLTKGSSGGGVMGQVGLPAQQGMGMYGEAGGFGGGGGGGAPSGAAAPTSAPPPTSYQGDSGMEPCQDAVYRILKSNEFGENGVHTDEICRRLQGRFTRSQIMQAIDFLQNEAHC